MRRHSASGFPITKRCGCATELQRDIAAFELALRNAIRVYPARIAPIWGTA